MHLEKNKPEVGMLIVKIGGPAYRIGMGGGAASSVASGSNKADLDFNAVQVIVPAFLLFERMSYVAPERMFRLSVCCKALVLLFIGHTFGKI